MEEKFMQDNFEESSTTIFPVKMFKVSREWIDIMFGEIKKTVMTKAISGNCSKDFLADLNEMALVISEDSRVSVKFPECETELQSNLSTVATPA